MANLVAVMCKVEVAVGIEQEIWRLTKRRKMKAPRQSKMVELYHYNSSVNTYEKDIFLFILSK